MYVFQTRTISFSPPHPTHFSQHSSRPPLIQSPNPQVLQKPQQLVVQLQGFGAPKPQTILTREPQGPPAHHFSRQPPTNQFRRPSQVLLEDEFLHRPVTFQDNNNIIGMLPPPPAPHHQQFQHQTSAPHNNQPSSHFQHQPTTHRQPNSIQHQNQGNQHVIRPVPPTGNPIHQRPPPTVNQQIHHVQPVFQQIQTPHQASDNFQFKPLTDVPRRPTNNNIHNTGNFVQHQNSRPSSNNFHQNIPVPPPVGVPGDPSDLSVGFINSVDGNSLSDLVINKVPPVNAGVLPLAHEKPIKLELFPPFNTG